MNDENKTLNNQTENNLEMPSLAPRVVKPIPVEETPKQEAAPTNVAQPQGTTPAAPTPAPTNEVGTVMVGKPMSNVVKPIPVGEIGSSEPQATIGGGQPPVEKKKSSPVAVVVLIIALIFLIGYVLFTYVFKGKIGGDSGLVGNVSDNYLVYANVKEGNKINFKINDKLKIVVKVSKLEVQDGVGTKAYLNVSEADGTDSIDLPYVWLDDDGSLKIDYKHVGDVAIFDSNQTTDAKEISIIDSEGKITKFSDFSKVSLNEEKGLLIDTYFVNDNKLEIEVTRITNTGFVKYGDLNSEVDLSQYEGNEELFQKYANYVSSDSVSICLDDYQKIPETTTVNALYTFSLSGDKLDLTNPEVSNKESFGDFYSENHDTLCQ